MVSSDTNLLHKEPNRYPNLTHFRSCYNLFLQKCHCSGQNCQKYAHMTKASPVAYPIACAGIIGSLLIPWYGRVSVLRKVSKIQLKWFEFGMVRRTSNLYLDRGRRTFFTGSVTALMISYPALTTVEFDSYVLWSQPIPVKEPSTLLVPFPKRNWPRYQLFWPVELAPESAPEN